MKLSERLRVLATPLVISAAVVTTITGVLMFFGIDRGLNRVAHEWISIVFAVAIGLHIWRNWNAFSRLLRTKIGLSLAILGVVLLTLSFVKIDRERAEPAFIRATHALLDAPLKTSLPTFGLDEKSFVKLLGQNKLDIGDQDVTLRDVALRNQMHPFGLIDIVLDGSAAFGK